MIIHNLCVIMQKPPKNSLKSRFSPFFCKIGLILHISDLRSGNYWLSSDLEQLELLEYAISSISNQPKAKKSTKTSFSKFVEKWLSLEAYKHCKCTVIQKSQKKVPNVGFNHLFSRIGPFWVIWSNKNFFDFWIIQNFQKPSLTSYQKKSRFQIFFGPEKTQGCS